MKSISFRFASLTAHPIVESTRVRLAVVALALLGAPLTANGQTVRYRLVPLAEITSAQTGCVPTAINAGGDVVGYCGAGELDSVAVRWRSDGTVESLDKWQNGTFTHARGINALGQIVGDGDDGDLRAKALVRGAGGWIGIDGSGGSYQGAYGVTDGGVVFGNFSTVGSPATETWDPVFWTYDAKRDRYNRSDLPKPPGAAVSGAFVFAVNSGGVAAGQVASDLVGVQGGLWMNDAPHSLVILANPSGVGSALAFGVSDDGRAAGMTYGAPSVEHAVLWLNDVSHTPLDLGTLPEDLRSEAYSVNNAGQVVGASFGTAAGRGFLYQNGALTELTTLLDTPYGAWTVNEPAGINNAGAIAATATLDGVRHPVMLVPFEKVKTAQTISFTLPAGPFRFGGAPFEVSASSTSGLPVAFQARGACTIAEATVTIVDTGICQVIASQGGDADWEPAPDVIANTTIGKGEAIVSFDASSLSQTFDGGVKAVSISTAPSGLALVVSFTGTPQNAGSYPVTATVDDPKYDGAATATLVIVQAAQVITFGALADRTLGDPAFTVSASGGGSASPVTFTGAGSCSVTGDVVTLTDAGSCTITAAQAGDSNYLAAEPVARSFTIAPAVTTESPLMNPGPQTNTEKDKVELALAAKGTRGAFSAANLPNGLRLDEKKGVIRGHVEKGAAANSPYAVMVKYTAPDGASFTETFSWTILARDVNADGGRHEKERN